MAASFQPPFTFAAAEPAALPGVQLQRARWKPEEQRTYAAALQSDARLATVIEQAQSHNLASAAATFGDVLRDSTAAAAMPLRDAGRSRKRKQPQFFDAHIQQMKMRIRQLQRNGRHAQQVRELRKRYHLAVRKKQRQMAQEDCEIKIWQLQKKPHDVFKDLRGSPRRLPAHLEDTEAWEEYFVNLAADNNTAVAQQQVNPNGSELIPCETAPAQTM